jgi:enolase
MIIKGVDAKSFLDSRKNQTIVVYIKTNVGNFSASAPNGKSKGRFESKPYKKSLEKDIEILKKFSDYFSEEHIGKFEDLRRIEDIIKSEVGANTMVALEFATLKAMAKEQKKEIWQLIDDSAKRIPRLVGNCVGGGLHSEEVNKRKPDFQEFLLIPTPNSAIKSFEINKEAKEKTEEFLRRSDEFFRGKKNDENAWMTSLNDKNVLEILREIDIPLGLDIASSSFYSRKKYRYNNPKLDRTIDEQLAYLSNLIKNFNIFYIEDPFEENDFESFAKLLKKFPNILIVGDDLTVTNYKRLERAIEMKSINSIIIKPNQNGSLIDLKEVCELAKKNNIKTIFSHRSGETKESILADLAFGFQADFIKCGITGKEREVKINRLIEIEKSLKV